MDGKHIFLLITACLLNGINGHREHHDCYSSLVNPYLMFGTKTAYDLIYKRPLFENNQIQDCQPVQLWLLARHGTRYPGRNTIRAMQQLEQLRNTIVQNHVDRKNGRLCYGDLDRFQVWKLNATMADAKLLTAQGRFDLYNMAKRYRNRFPDLFNKGYSENLFQFRHTNTERTRQSAKAFAEGLFGVNQEIWIPEPLENDTIIKPYENCTSWRHHVRNDPWNRREYELFQNGLEMNQLIHNVSLRLGFLYDLPIDTVMLMYDMCRYDKAWVLYEKSAWCAAFTNEELAILEYGEDLKSFYEAGYGHPLNTRLGCHPFKNMIEKFASLEPENFENRYQPHGVFHFTHSDMLAMIIARLGLASHGKPMRHDNYLEQKNRQWSTSKLTPFAANLAAVFYKCSSGEHNRIQFLLNEKVIDFPGCDEGLCSWSDIRERYGDLIYTCDLGWCSSGFRTSTTKPFLLLSLLPCLYFYLGRS